MYRVGQGCFITVVGPYSGLNRLRGRLYKLERPLTLKILRVKAKTVRHTLVVVILRHE
jgi:hypothetical protein